MSPIRAIAPTWMAGVPPLETAMSRSGSTVNGNPGANAGNSYKKSGRRYGRPLHQVMDSGSRKFILDELRERVTGISALCAGSRRVDFLPTVATLLLRSGLSPVTSFRPQFPDSRGEVAKRIRIIPETPSR